MATGAERPAGGDGPPVAPSPRLVAWRAWAPSAPAFAGGGPWRALRNPNYRLYFVGQVVSQVGGWMQRTALAWLVLELTGSSVALGAVWALQFAPVMVFSLVSGVVADRWPKRRLLLGIQVAAMAQAAALAGLTLAGWIEIWHIYVLSLWLGVAAAFEMPVRLAFVGELVPRDEIQSAIGLNSSVFNAARIVGPGVGGLIIAGWGIGWCFVLNAVSYMGALAAIWLMRPGQLQSRRSHAAPLWTQLVDGLRYTVRTRQLALPLLLLGIISTLGYNYGVALPLLARFALDANAVGFGALNAALGVGALLGSLAVASLGAPSPRRLPVYAMGFSVTLLAVSQVPWYWLALCVLGVLGFVGVTYTTSTNTTLQLTSREEFRGRVLSVYTLVFAGTVPIGAAVTGGLAELWGIRATLAFEAGLCLLTAVAGWAYLRQSGEDWLPRKAGAA